MALVVWDIENVRLPRNMSTAAVISEVKRAFVFSAGFVEHASICCMTPVSLHAMTKQSSAFVHEAVPLMDIRIASHSRPKLGADFVLRRELGLFMDRFSASAATCRIVLLTGDVDFLEPVQRAIRMGFDVLLVHYGKSTSRLLLDQLYSTPPVEWVSFLARANGGVAPELSYDETPRPYHAKLAISDGQVATSATAKVATSSKVATSATAKVTTSAKVATLHGPNTAAALALATGATAKVATNRKPLLMGHMAKIMRAVSAAKAAAIAKKATRKPVSDFNHASVEIHLGAPLDWAGVHSSWRDGTLSDLGGVAVQVRYKRISGANGHGLEHSKMRLVRDDVPDQRMEDRAEHVLHEPPALVREQIPRERQSA